MDRKTINRKLHEFMNKCWHDFSHHQRRCSLCKADWRTTDDNPDYCSDSSPRSLLNSVMWKLAETRGGDQIDFMLTLREVMLDGGKTANIDVMATAEQIARACVACIEESAAV